MSYYSKCPYCGANLDPGEECDCMDRKRDMTFRTKREMPGQSNISFDGEGKQPELIPDRERELTYGHEAKLT